MKPRNMYPFVVMISLILLFSPDHNFLMAQNKGYEIMKKNDRLKEPEDSYCKSLLVLVNKNDNKKRRKFEMYTRKRDEGSDSFYKILAPADIAGMKFLSIAHEGEDEQRMYLPALGRTRKISGSGKDGKFLGSDIYFYDLEDHDLDEFTYKYLTDTTWENNEYHLVEAFPKDENVPYSKIINWVRKDNYYVYKMDMYDKKQNRLLKSMVINETKIIQDIILPLKMKFVNRQTDHRTLYLRKNYKVNTGLDSDIFSIQNLAD